MLHSQLLEVDKCKMKIYYTSVYHKLNIIPNNSVCHYIWSSNTYRHVIIFSFTSEVISYKKMSFLTNINNLHYFCLSVTHCTFNTIKN